MWSTLLLAGLLPLASCVPLAERQGNGISRSFKSLPKPILAPYYMYFGNEDTLSLSKAYDTLGMNAAVIGFASAPRGKCQLTNDLSGLEQNMKDFVARGGATAISFGGNLRDQTIPRQHIQQACQDVNSLAQLIKDSMAKYNTHNVDFDIEDDDLLQDQAAAQRLANAIMKVKQSVPDMFVMYTLATGSTGMPSDRLTWIQAAKNAGLQLDIVSVMSMNMGVQDNAQGSQGAIIGGAKQLAQIYGTSLQNATQKMGMVPAIGMDDTHVVLNLDGARTLATFAKQNQIGLQSFWNFNRDFPGGRTTSPELGAASSPDQRSPQEFFKTMHSVLFAGENASDPNKVKNVEDSKNQTAPNPGAIAPPAQKTTLPGAGTNGGTPGKINC